MGQGDQKPKYTPTHGKSFCAVTKQYYDDIAMRPCPNEIVQKRFGVGCKVSVYVCAKCKYGKVHPLFFGVKCEYETNN